jgi:hypothetical protein
MSRIEVLRRIVEGHQAERIDGVMVDVQTAAMLVAVYDKLSVENQQRFDEPPLGRLVEFGWQQVSRGRG